MPGKGLNKKELAYAKAMTDLGHSPSSVANTLGRSHHTVIVHLQHGCDDPEVHEMVELIKRSELKELQIIGWKSRTILNNYLDRVLSGEKEANPISVTAVLDRTFQQRQILAGQPTQIVTYTEHDDREQAARKRLAVLDEVHTPQTFP